MNKPLLIATQPLSVTLGLINSKIKEARAEAWRRDEEEALTQLKRKLLELGIGPVTGIGIAAWEEAEQGPAREKPSALARIEGRYLFGFLPEDGMEYSLRVMNSEERWIRVKTVEQVAVALGFHYVPPARATALTILEVGEQSPAPEKSYE